MFKINNFADAYNQFISDKFNLSDNFGFPHKSAHCPHLVVLIGDDIKCYIDTVSNWLNQKWINGSHTKIMCMENEHDLTEEYLRILSGEFIKSGKFENTYKFLVAIIITSWEDNTDKLHILIERINKLYINILFLEHEINLYVVVNELRQDGDEERHNSQRTFVRKISDEYDTFYTNINSIFIFSNRNSQNKFYTDAKCDLVAIDAICSHIIFKGTDIYAQYNISDNLNAIRIRKANGGYFSVMGCNKITALSEELFLRILNEIQKMIVQETQKSVDDIEQILSKNIKTSISIKTDIDTIYGISGNTVKFKRVFDKKYSLRERFIEKIKSIFSRYKQEISYQDFENSEFKTSLANRYALFISKIDSKSSSENISENFNLNNHILNVINETLGEYALNATHIFSEKENIIYQFINREIENNNSEIAKLNSQIDSEYTKKIYFPKTSKHIAYQNIINAIYFKKYKIYLNNKANTILEKYKRIVDEYHLKIEKMNQSIKIVSDYTALKVQQLNSGQFSLEDDLRISLSKSVSEFLEKTPPKSSLRILCDLRASPSQYYDALLEFSFNVYLEICTNSEFGKRSVGIEKLMNSGDNNVGYLANIKKVLDGINRYLGSFLSLNSSDIKVVNYYFVNPAYTADISTDMNTYIFDNNYISRWESISIIENLSINDIDYMTIL